MLIQLLKVFHRVLHILQIVLPVVFALHVYRTLEILSIQYGQFTAVLLKDLQEQQDLIQAQKKHIMAQQKELKEKDRQIRELRSDFVQLEARMAKLEQVSQGTTVAE